MHALSVPAVPARVAPPAGRWRRAAWLALALLATLAAGAARADEDPPGRVGRVAQVSGDVRTVDADGAWVALPRNQPLATGDRVITDKEGRAVLQVGSSTVRLGAYSDLSVTRIDDEKIRLHFDHGQMAVRVRSTEVLGELSIETDEGVWVPHHPGYFRFDRVPGQLLSAQAWSGDMLLEAPDSSLPVAAGQRAEVWREGAQQTTHYRMVEIPVDKFSDWALVEDRLEDRYAVGNDPKSPVPAEMTGASDLARYGSWSSDSDYGNVWTPSAVASGWAPYQDGRWSWVAPWGWTWIDNAPWGFAPFHYGRWVSIGGRWAWCPGNWGPRPVYAPGLVGWFGGNGFAFGGGPAIGWVPLGPWEPFYPGYAVSPIYWNLVNGPIGHPPVRRTPGPVSGRPRIVPVGPIAYSNRGAPNAVSIVPAASLGAPRAAVTLPPEQRGEQHRLLGQVGDGKATVLPPPAPPAGRSPLTRSAPIVRLPAAPGTPPAAPGIAPATPAAPAIAPPRTAPPVRVAPPARPGMRPANAATADGVPGNLPVIVARPVAPVAVPVPATVTATTITPPALARPMTTAAPAVVVAPVAPVAPAAPSPGPGLAGGQPSRGGGAIGGGVRAPGGVSQRDR